MTPSELRAKRAELVDQAIAVAGLAAGFAGVMRLEPSREIVEQLWAEDKDAQALSATCPEDPVRWLAIRDAELEGEIAELDRRIGALEGARAVARIGLALLMTLITATGWGCRDDASQDTHHAGTPHAEASPDDRQRLGRWIPVQGYPFGPVATMPGSSTEERRSRGQVRAGEREPQARECPSHRRTPPLLKVAGSTPAPAIKDRQGTAATPSGDAVLAALPRPHPLALMLSQRCGPFCECLCCHDDRSRRYALLAFLAEGC